MKRRHFLGLLACLPLAARSAPAARAARVVVAGAGVAGIAFALTLKRLAPRVEITLIEPAERFAFGAAVLDYLFGRETWEGMTRGYDALAARDLRLLKAQVRTVEPDRRRVRTSIGQVDYDILVLATGIRLASEEIGGLAEQPEAGASLYERERLRDLAARVAAFRGGTALISIPAPPQSCPPAAYEFALLLAENIRARKLKGKVLVLDASTNPQPQPLAAAFESAFQKAAIEYVPSIRVARLEAGARRVHTADGESFGYDLACLIPPHKAARFIEQAGLVAPGDPFVQVDPLTFRAARHEAIYALGDCARTPYARTAAAAHDAARLCAHGVARVLGAAAPQPEFALEAPCYPYANPDEAMRLDLTYRVARGELDARVIAETQPARSHAAARRAWQRRLMQELFAS
jgi:NADPH-dependent 2,4-dienoyl-CoA reductase/sulfur reductase-like enzyme